MKNLSSLIVALFLSVCAIAQQPQMQNWFIAPKKVHMQLGSPPQVTIIAGTPATAIGVANGFYDNAGTGNLLFYIADGNVYDYNNSLIGALNPQGAPAGAEVIIVPFGTNDACQSKFNIFSTGGGFTSYITLYQSVLDMKSFSLTSSQIDVMPVVQEFGAIAVGPIIQGTQGDRYLYFLGGPGTLNAQYGYIRKLLIKNDGTVVPQGTIYPLTQYPNSGAEIFARELDLSPDGKYLAWGSFAPATQMSRYHFLELNPITGDYVSGTYQQFNIPVATGNNSDGFRGVEFYQTQTGELRLFMGAGSSGIYYTVIPNYSVFTHVSNSYNYGFSQLELSFNGYMYASSDPVINQFNVGAFDPAQLNPSMFFNNQPSFTLTNPNPPNSGWGAAPFYTLPDQIDGQDYSLIIPTAVSPVNTISSYNFNAGTTTTWSYGNNPFNISTTPVQVIHELRISSNSKLTISGMTFRFSPTAKVIIENGSTLTLDNGSVFTSNYEGECPTPYTWVGVEVWGSPSNQSQNINPPVVGKLILKNSSKIEHAQWGARAQRPGLSTYRGGIIIAQSNSIFFNNKVDVEFLPYQNINNGIQYGNKSSFNNVTFSNDATWLTLFSGSPLHVYIDGCRGIRFTNCHFFNSTSMFQKLSIGIKSNNANFTVSGSDFSNLYRAIDAYKDNISTNSYSVTYSSFSDNELAIRNQNVNNINLLRNTFTIGGHQRAGVTHHYGIRNNFGTGFTIEENTFNLSVNSSTANKIGILIRSSGTAANQIYKNTFNGITYGNYSYGQNRDNSPNGFMQGLQWLCNTNTGNTHYDFYATGNIPNDGVRLNQGTSAYPAGNTFSFSPGTNYSDFNNNTSVALNYYHKSTIPAQTPLDYNSLVIPISTGSNSNSCPSHICDPPCDYLRLSAAAIQQLYSDYDAAETAYLNMLYAYNQLMDGGSTNALLTEIQLNWSADVVTLFNELMERAPYLSQEILREVASMDVLPQAMLLTVCMANPDATKDERFLHFLQYEIPNPLPQYMIDLVISSWHDGTARTTMENMLASKNQQMGFISDRILTDLYYKLSLDIDSIDPNDTTNYPQQINYWLSRIQTVEAKYDLIENYFEEENFEGVAEILESIPVNFKLSAEQVQAHNDYIYFYQFREALFAAGRSFSELEGSQIDELIAFTQGEQNFAKGLAQNVLCFYYDICRDDNLEEISGRMMLPANAPQSVNINNINDRVNYANQVTVSPNPASDIAVFKFFLPSTKQQLILTICDMAGKEINRFALKDSQDVIIWETSSVNDGVYYYFVKDGTTNIAKGKISVRK